MSGFIRIQTSDETDVCVAIDEIASFGPDDKYRPNEVARLRPKDGTLVRTSWRHSFESIYQEIHAGEGK